MCPCPAARPRRPGRPPAARGRGWTGNGSGRADGGPACALLLVFARILRRALLVPQRVDRVEPRGLARWIEAEEDPDGGGEAEGEEDRPRAHLGGQAREARHQVG